MSSTTNKGKWAVRCTSIAIARPTPTSPLGFTRADKKQNRSDARWMDKDDKRTVVRYERYLTYASKIVLLLTLHSLHRPLTAKTKMEMEANMERLLAPSHHACCTSAQYVDRNGEPVLYYFGRHLVEPQYKPNVRVSAKVQYRDQSVEEVEEMLRLDKSLKLVQDGLNDLKCEHYQLAVQALSVDTKLHKLFDPSRHEGKNEMDFQCPADVISSPDLLLHPDDSAAYTSSDMSFSSESSEDIESTDEELHPSHIGQETVNVVSDFVVEDGDPDWEDELVTDDDGPDGIGMVVDGEEVGMDKDDDGDINMATYDTVNVEHNGLIQTGVIHLVHGWTMRGHPDQLYVSGDATSGSVTVSAAGSHYYLTQSVARTVALAFKAVFPCWYDTYREAFEAGVWFADDPGPFLGCAIVYKLQGQLHRDRHDVGPSVSFPVGQYTGGEMIFPQLNVKLQYSPGDFCIFFSSDIYHKVAPFVPLPQISKQAMETITPGRIGSVFFFPQNSLRM